MDTTERMKTFLLSKSERQLAKRWYKEGELNTLSSEVDAFVKAGKTGDVSPIFQNGNSLQYSCLENAMDRGAW